MAIGADDPAGYAAGNAATAADDSHELLGARFVTANVAEAHAKALCLAAKEGTESDAGAEWTGCLAAVGRQMGAVLIPPHRLAAHNGGDDTMRLAAQAWLASQGMLSLVQLGKGRTGWAVATERVHKAPVVGEAARAAMALEEAAYVLEAQIRDLGTRTLRVMEEGRKAVKAKNRQLALRHIARAKALRETMARREAAAEKVEQVLVSIASAATDAQVLEACALGAVALREITAAGRNGRESAVEAAGRIMDEVADATEQQRELEDAIATHLSSGSAMSSDIDDTELAKDLEALERQMAAEAATAALAVARNVSPSAAAAAADMQDAEASKLAGRLADLSLEQPSAAPTTATLPTAAKKKEPDQPIAC